MAKALNKLPQKKLNRCSWTFVRGMERSTNNCFALGRCKGLMQNGFNNDSNADN